MFALLHCARDPTIYPRVLRTLLPVLDPGQVIDFSGPVTRFHAESEDGAGIIDFSHTAGILKLTSTSLANAGKPRQIEAPNTLQDVV